MLQKLKDWMMPIAMMLGGIFYPQFNALSFLTPYLIFFMLLFTFSKLSPRGIRFSRLHFILLAIQLVTGFAVYEIMKTSQPELAQGAFICFLAPTATSAAVITGILGGSVGFLTSFTLLSNLGVALLAPVFFSIVGFHQEFSFWESFISIFIKIFPLLILPLLVAWLIRYSSLRIQNMMLRFSKTPFYLWSVALAIVTGRTVNALVELQQHDVRMEVSLGLVSLLVCCVQFFIGKKLGSRYDNRIAAGQALGQKNTILAIWMTQVFLNPVAALAPSTYILWQNIINSYQVWKAHRIKEKAENQ
ncbi:MAG: bile acid:sodium symporter family protein [Bacteroidales bacterium]